MYQHHQTQPLHTRSAEELHRALVPCLAGPTDTLPSCLQRVHDAAHALVHGTPPAVQEVDLDKDTPPLTKDTSGLQAALVALADRLQAGQGLAHTSSEGVVGEQERGDV